MYCDWCVKGPSIDTRYLVGRKEKKKEETMMAASLVDKVVPIVVKAVAVVDDDDDGCAAASAPFFEDGEEEEEEEAGVRDFLRSRAWPLGLQNALVHTLKKIPIRFFICDDSGSMINSGGTKFVDDATLIQCSRWDDLCQSIRFHAELAHYSKGAAPCSFRMLNRGGGCPIDIGVGGRVTVGDASPLARFLRQLEEPPRGATPLCSHISAVVEQIKARESELRSNNQMACIVIATDGVPSHGYLNEAMRPLKNLPVWIVLRLFTSDKAVVKYWNTLEEDLELDMDVIDDFRGETREVRAHNRWLTYGEPLHRLREFGVPIKEMDLLDERALDLNQVRVMCAHIFGGPLEAYPHPDTDWDGFAAAVARLNASTGGVYCDAKRARRPWVNLRAMPRRHCRRGGCVIL